MTKYIHSQTLTVVSVKVQSPNNFVCFYINRYTPFKGFVLFMNDNESELVRCNRHIYKEIPRALNALWIEIGKYLEDRNKVNEREHTIIIENFSTA